MKEKALQILAVVVAILGIMVFCFATTDIKILSLDALPPSFIGALLGAVISGVITVVLLIGQSSAEEIKERNVKIFEKKSKIFQNYIEYLWEILREQKISIEKYEKLRKDFSIRLMIYLSKKSIRSIAVYIEKIGSCLDNKNNINYAKIKEDIFGVINILSNELGLGGQIDLEIDSKLETPIFPLLFKQTILNELNRALSNIELSEGKYCKEDELIENGEWGGEYVCFDFKRFKGCKLIIGSFSKYCPHAGTWMWLFIEKSLHEIDEFRYNDTNEYRFCEFSKNLVEIWDGVEGDEGNWVELTSSRLDNVEYNVLGKFDPPNSEGWYLFVDNLASIEYYRDNYQDVAGILGRRAAYWFKHGQIWERKEDVFIPVIEFLENYLGNRKN
jgi:gas vesicle protein